MLRVGGTPQGCAARRRGAVCLLAARKEQGLPLCDVCPRASRGQHLLLPFASPWLGTVGGQLLFRWLLCVLRSPVSPPPPPVLSSVSQGLCFVCCSPLLATCVCLLRCVSNGLLCCFCLSLSQPDVEDEGAVCPTFLSLGGGLGVVMLQCVPPKSDPCVQLIGHVLGSV